MTEQKKRKFKMLILKKSQHGIIPMLSDGEISVFEDRAKGFGLTEIDDYRVYRLSDYADERTSPQRRIANLKEMHLSACLAIQEQNIDMGLLVGMVVVFPDSQAALLSSGLLENDEVTDATGEGVI